jgi:hypothetical protein
VSKKEEKEEEGAKMMCQKSLLKAKREGRNKCI